MQRWRLMKIYIKLWRKTEISWLPVQAFLGEGLKMPCSVAIILIAVIVTMGNCGDLAFAGIFFFFFNFGHSNGHSTCVFSPGLSALRAADKEALCRLHVWEPWPEGACVWCQRNWDSPSWQLPCCFQGTFQTIPSVTSWLALHQTQRQNPIHTNKKSCIASELIEHKTNHTRRVQWLHRWVKLEKLEKYIWLSHCILS